MQKNELCDIEDSLSVLRFKNQDDIRNRRNKKRDAALAQNRMLNAENEIKNEVTLSQVKGFIQELKQREKKKLNLLDLKRIKNYCSHPEFIELFFKINGAFNALVTCIKDKDAKTQLEAIACFTNLACGPHKLSFRIAKTVGPYLVSFLAGSSRYLQAQCAWTVRNLANDCIDCYYILKSQGVFSNLLNALESPIAEVVESVIYALSACLKHRDVDLIHETNIQMYTNILLKLIEEDSLPFNCVQEAAFALSSVFSVAVQANYDCKNFDILKLVKCFKKYVSQETNECLAVLQFIRCLGYLSASPFVARILFDSDLFNEAAVEILKHHFTFLRKEFLWVLTNISVYQVIDNNHSLFLPVMNTLETFLDPLNDAAITALYYVCCTTKENKNMCSLYKTSSVLQKIIDLQNFSGKENLSKPCNICIHLICS